MDSEDFDPLHGEAPKEIPLSNAPLASVLCQVRFPEIVQVRDINFIGGFQEKVRASYPLFSSDLVQTFNVLPHALQSNQDQLWRLSDADANWRISLGANFVALETKKYSSRADFLKRLTFVLDALEETIRPTHVWRVGVRYVDRVPTSALGNIRDMLRHEMAGLSATELRSSFNYSVSEVACRVDEGNLLVKWGILPAHGSHEPEVMPQIDDESWFLDIDVSHEHHVAPRQFRVDELVFDAERKAARCYSFFRWAVTEEFLRRFGGEI
ncbi:TIGR04255 family protein [Rhizobium sp. NZLR1]|uniref:TIGR04255 family protein n=1 Tax=Rhizobium sp. NZLR1 TaxID=2731096 RepID=UPI001A981BC9|nr:TIGR04255 family protein [Rhizobium sp. NZLR1]MBX5202244.1 TIGR04255 family protein [Rhizobium sp. NZLR1]QSZ20842.1 TIGR04255 family protein [Rhizobium sp. NZLR1]